MTEKAVHDGECRAGQGSGWARREKAVQDGKEENGGRGFVNDVPQTKKPIPKGMDFFAVRKGLEPSTSGVTGRHSNQLNYRTNAGCAETRMQR